MGSRVPVATIEHDGYWWSNRCRAKGWYYSRGKTNLHILHDKFHVHSKSL